MDGWSSPGDGPPVSLFVVEDDPRSRVGLVDVLGFEPDLEVVGWATTIAAARIEAPPLTPSVVLVDYGLPDGTGADLILGLRPTLPATSFVVHASLLDDSIVRQCLAVGAFACLPKQIRLAPLLSVIRTAASRPL